MKFLALQFRNLALTTLLSIVPALHAQTTAATTPVGVINRTIPAALDASTPSNTTVSIPLYAPADYISTVATIPGATDFTLAGAAWQAGQFATAAAPRFVRIKNSTAVPGNIGRFFLVSANTTNQLTVVLPSGVANISEALSVGDVCEIMPANTLGSIFGTAANPPALAAGGSPDDADNILIWSGSGWDTYYWTGNIGAPANIWKKTGNLDRSNTILYPDEAVFVIRRSTTGSATLTFRGTVPSTAEQSVVEASGSTFLSNRFPVDTTLGALGLQNIPGWVAGGSPDDADNVFIFSGGGWDTYYWTGLVGTPNNIWKKTGNLDRSNTPIPTGTGVFITHGNGSLTLTQTLPYSP